VVRFILSALLAGALLGVNVPTVSATPPVCGERPGYGYGDTCFDHEDGPPGLNLEQENERPGYGYGDENHLHEDGPPGANSPA